MTPPWLSTLQQAVDLHQKGEVAKSLPLYESVLSASPNQPDAVHYMGYAYAELKQYDKAAPLLQQSIQLAPTNAMFLNNVANLTLEAGGRLGPIHQVEGWLLAAIKVDPNFASLYQNLANYYKAIGRFIPAYNASIECLKRSPNHAGAHHMAGSLLVRFSKLKEADAHLKRAIELEPKNSAFWYSYATNLEQLKQYEAALKAFQTSLDMNPTYVPSKVMLFNLKQQLADWQNHDAELAEIDQIANQDENALLPLLHETFFMNPPRALKLARQVCQDLKNRMGQIKVYEHSKRQPEKLTIGYLSCDFFDHATAHLMRTLIQHHDKDQFVINLYSYGPDDGSDYRKKLMNDADNFIDARAMSDGELAQKIYDDQVDILVDLKGHTQNNRIGVCAYKPAPVSATYLGYPGTLGADFIDYNIVDKIVVPEDQAQHYAEALAYLPDCYQVNDNEQAIANTPASRTAAGLPEDVFVFASFNSLHKVTPDIFATWLEILKAVDNSILWLFAPSAPAKKNLEAYTKNLGVDPARVIFADRLPKDQHLARLKFADLFLDTTIYNAHTTASDALWAGVPVLTCQGQHFASRVASSLLTNIGLEELIVQDIDSYKSTAIELAKDAKKLEGLKDKLSQNRLTTPLFDTAKFARGIESLYQQMWQNYQDGHSPKIIREINE